MAPILGIMASQISGHLWAPSGAYDSIATTTVGAGGTSSISFTSIPQGYTHLQIRAFGHTNRSTGAGGDGTRFNFNSDTGANYTGHSIEANGSTVIGFAEGTSQTKYAIYGLTGATGATTFGTFIVDILDYSNTNKYKTALALNGFDKN